MQFFYICASRMVSIIIPYIDEHDYLAEAVASATQQHGVDTEIIIVCNAPEANPVPEVIEKTGGAIKCIHESRRGSAYARNAGLQQAQGEWVQFLDVDDLLEKNKIYDQITSQDADIVVSPHIFQFLDGKKEKSKWLPADLWIGMLNSGLGSTSSMLFKRQALLEVGGWSLDYQTHQEYELLFRLVRAGKKVRMDEHWNTIVRQRKQGSITITSSSFRAAEGLKLRESMWNHLKDNGWDTPERFEAFRQYIFRQLRGLYRQDREMAIHVYRKYFSSIPFSPKEVTVPGYSILYKLLGFERTESLILFCKKFQILPS